MDIKFISQYTKIIFGLLCLVSSSCLLSKDIRNDPTLHKSKAQKNQCSMKVAWTDWPPYLTAGKNSPTGIQIDLINLVSKKMNCQITYKKLSWEESITAIKNGTIDFLGRASKFSERETYAYFSDSYRDDLLVLTIRKGESKNYNFDDFEKLLEQGFRLGVLKGGYFGEEIESLRNNKKYENNFIDFIYEKDILVALVNKKIDGAFEAPFTVDNAVMDNPLYSQLEEYPFEMLVGKLYFMFSKKTVSKERVNAFNRALKAVKDSSAYKKHWFWSTIN